MNRRSIPHLSQEACVAFPSSGVDMLLPVRAPLHLLALVTATLVLGREAWFRTVIGPADDSNPWLPQLISTYPLPISANAKRAHVYFDHGMIHMAGFN